LNLESVWVFNEAHEPRDRHARFGRQYVRHNSHFVETVVSVELQATRVYVFNLAVAQVFKLKHVVRQGLGDTTGASATERHYFTSVKVLSGNEHEVPFSETRELTVRRQFTVACAICPNGLLHHGAQLSNLVR